ncbi:hypothetical protein D3C78_504350 [compost metagenome]
MAQVVTGQEAVEFREFIDNELTVIATAIQNGTVNSPDRGVVFPERFSQFNRHRLGIKDIAAQQHRTDAQNVIGCFPVDQRSLPGGIGVNHAANGSAVAGRELRREEIAVRFQELVELIFYHARFNTHPALFGIDLNNTVHITRHINDDALIQSLTIGAGSAAARGKDQRRETFLGRQTRNERHVCGGTRENDGIGK